MSTMCLCDNVETRKMSKNNHVAKGQLIGIPDNNGQSSEGYIFLSDRHIFYVKKQSFNKKLAR